MAEYRAAFSWAICNIVLFITRQHLAGNYPVPISIASQFFLIPCSPSASILYFSVIFTSFPQQIHVRAMMISGNKAEEVNEKIRIGVYFKKCPQFLALPLLWLAI